MKTAGSLRTKVSKEATDFAGRFKMLFSTFKLAPAGYVPEMTKPEGPSTGGGVQALQRIRLVSRSGNPVLVIGSVNKQEGKAELRTFEHLEAIHEARFKEPLALNRDQYWELVGKMQRFFEASSVKVTMAELPGKIIIEDEGHGEPAGSSKLWIAVVALVMLAGAGGWWWVHTH
jgi:hypothetical protein